MNHRCVPKTAGDVYSVARPMLHDITVRQTPCAPGLGGLVGLGSLEPDGTALPGPVIPLLDDGREHTVDKDWHGRAARGLN